MDGEVSDEEGGAAVEGIPCLWSGTKANLANAMSGSVRRQVTGGRRSKTRAPHQGTGQAELSAAASAPQDLGARASPLTLRELNKLSKKMHGAGHDGPAAVGDAMGVLQTFRYVSRMRAVKAEFNQMHRKAVRDSLKSGEERLDEVGGPRAGRGGASRTPCSA